MSPGKPSSKGAAGRRATVSRPAKSSYWGIVSQAITKIRDEPFLFVIAVIALLIGFTVVASRRGSPDLRFIVAVIALLACVAIVGHHLMAAIRSRGKSSEAEVGAAAAASAGDGSVAERNTIAARPQEPAPIWPPTIGLAPPVPRLFIGRDQCLRELKQRLGVVGGKTGSCRVEFGEPRKGIEAFEEWLAIAQQLGDRVSDHQVYGGLCFAYGALDDPGASIEYANKKLRITREIGDRRGEGYALLYVGTAHLALGDAARALELYEQALTI